MKGDAASQCTQAMSRALATVDSHGVMNWMQESEAGAEIQNCGNRKGDEHRVIREGSLIAGRLVTLSKQEEILVTAGIDSPVSREALHFIHRGKRKESPWVQH